MNIKHSKFKNTGILFELLVRQIASDTLANTNTKAVKIVKRFFTNSELAKEHKLYHTIVTAPKLSEVKASALISTIIEQSKKLNKEQLNKEKYNLIKEIKKSYNLESFFKSKINNYPVLAATYTLLELSNAKKFVGPKQLIDNKNTILEHIIRKPLTETKQQVSEVEEELTKEDKNVRILAYKFLIERFNKKYANLSTKQKSVLKEYINHSNDTVKLKEYINNNLTKVKTELTKIKPTISDKITEIKLNEVINLIKPIPEKSRVKDEHLVALLQYYQLVEEIKKVK
jgi:hypothetical protein